MQFKNSITSLIYSKYYKETIYLLNLKVLLEQAPMGHTIALLSLF